MSDSVLIKIERDPLFGMTRDEYVERLTRLLAGRVDAAYFFGSFTGVSFNRFSDIDLILIRETDTPFPLRAIEFEDVLDLVPSTDILVYTRREFDKLTGPGAVGFWKSVRESLHQFI
ncbi:MAG TPA: nucleotidyltransferase domain-containing protein [Spirochaetota bacterium]|nr:nucleotidyltransferase domain-containing protein [Spirochaetota bacterium]HNT09590.1 nucleotidyltransferase domain-containing protein [Spirochaetota bacterium]